jgi:glycosyltransferase involved in cell wall biosynthesis
LARLRRRNKDAFLGQSLALLFPIKWPEPFGLVMAEAMATGTPVITTRCGSVLEVVEDGVTGIISDSVEEMALACATVGALDRAACRRRVEARFSLAAMVDGYEALYRRLTRQRDETAHADWASVPSPPSPGRDGRQLVPAG